MFRRENAVGILLLILVGVVSAILVVAIVTGRPPSVPEGMGTPLTVFGFIMVAIMLWQRFGSRFRR